MRNLFLLAAVALLLPVGVAPADIITQWNFNGGTGNDPSTGTLTPNVGTGTASLVGGTTYTFADGDNLNGITDPGSGTDDSGWAIRGFAAQGMENEQRGVEFKTSSVGFENITVTWDQFNGSNASRYLRVQYTTNGTSWNNLTGLIDNFGTSWFNGLSASLTSISGVNDNADFAIRFVAAFAPTTMAYATSGGGSSYDPTNSWRFDMVTIHGMPLAMSVPEVSAFLFGGLASALATLIARRRRPE